MFLTSAETRSATVCRYHIPVYGASEPGTDGLLSLTLSSFSHYLAREYRSTALCFRGNELPPRLELEGRTPCPDLDCCMVHAIQAGVRRDDVMWGSTLTISANSTVQRQRQAGKGVSDEQDPHVELPGIGESGAVSSNPISRNLSTKSVWFSRSVIRNPRC